jgi:hypothetical protein
MKTKCVSFYDGEHCGWTIKCPACQMYHFIPNSCKFNGNFNCPTFTPSLKLVTPYANDKKRICHSVIVNGKISFLSDCTHEMVNKITDLLELV